MFPNDLGDDQTEKLNPMRRAAPLPPRLGDSYDYRRPRELRFVHALTNESFTVPLRPYMVVGRRTSVQDYEVVVDLSPFDARKNGVSRFHAMILFIGDNLMIKDLSSTNGTHINGYALEALQEYPLYPGDGLTIGKLNVGVEFVY